jgi:hypothetical protein
VKGAPTARAIASRAGNEFDGFMGFLLREIARKLLFTVGALQGFGEGFGERWASLRLRPPRVRKGVGSVLTEHI